MDSADKNSDRPDSSDLVSPRDGLIEFSTYSTAQLEDLQHSINRSTHPRDFINLSRELSRRRQMETEPGSADHEYAVQFTARGGLIGWMEALFKRCPLHGHGSIRFETDDVVLRGWQRTWLGAPLQTEIHIDSRHIRNAVQEVQWVTFERRPDEGRVRRFQCAAADARAAASIVALLPSTRSEGFEEAWTQLRNFRQTLDAATPVAWVTPILIALNVVVFAALAFAGAGVLQPNPETLIRWGSNFGMRTIDGQWWRLLSSIFLHFGLLHLLLNMWVLWGVGRLVERLYGNWVFVFLYLCAGAAGALTSVAWDPLKNSAGASGAIFGILGACLAFLLHRDMKVPNKIIRAHGLSTLAFVLFSLISGVMQTGIDNAAHVGGFLVGVVLGWVLARPLDMARASMPKRKSTVAFAVILVIAITGFWQMHALRSSQSVPERFWLAHDWFLTGQVRALRTENDIQARRIAGNISSAEIAEKFEHVLIPFWSEADSRLLNEPESDDEKMRQFSQLVAEFVRLRQEWAFASLGAIKDNDSGRSLDAVDLASRAKKVLVRIERLEMHARASRVHSLSESGFVQAVRNVFAGLRWKCVLAPRSSVHLEGPSAMTDGPRAKVAAGCDAQRAFQTGDYAALESMLYPEASSLAELDDGGSRLAGVYLGLADLFEQELSIESAFARLGEWRKSSPDAGGPALVEAILLRSWAWSSRGSGYNDTVSPQRWELFALRTETAVAALEDAHDGALDSSPLFYQLSLALQRDRSGDIRDLKQTFDEGIEKFPDYYPLYGQMLTTLMPRWGGSYAQVADFISEVVERTREQHGNEMYTRLYWMFAELEGDGTDLFSNTSASWGVMRQGFDDIVQRYPKSEWIRNNYAAFACRAKDADSYREVRSTIEGKIISSAWKGAFTLERCDELM